MTRPGLDRLDETLPGHLEIIEQSFTGRLDPSELAALLDALRKIRDAVHPQATAGIDRPDCGEQPPGETGHAT